jgi:hypothetical protein
LLGVAAVSACLACQPAHTWQFLPWLKVDSAAAMTLIPHDEIGGTLSVSVRRDASSWESVGKGDFIDVAEVDQGRAALVLFSAGAMLFRTGGKEPTWVAPKDCRLPMPRPGGSSVICAVCVESEISKQEDWGSKGCSRFEVREVAVDGRLLTSGSVDVPQTHRLCTWSSKVAFDHGDAMVEGSCGHLGAVVLSLQSADGPRPKTGQLDGPRWLFGLQGW